MKVITMTVYRRPGYLARTLAALAVCDGVGEYLILPHVEPGSAECRSLVEGIGFAECRPTFHQARLGCSENTQSALRHGFALADEVIHLEEDALLAPDALAMFEWALGRYRDEPAVASVTAYQRWRSPEDPDPADRHRLATRSWFHGVAFATWRDRFALVDGTLCDGPGYYDSAMLEGWVRRRGLVEVHPLLARVDHIGLETSTQEDPMYDAAWMAANHSAGRWAGTDPPGPGVFHVV